MYIRLKELRLSKHITQKEISNYLNIAENSYQRYELGTREPKLSIMIQISDYYNVSIDYLVGRTDNPDINK